MIPGSVKRTVASKGQRASVARPEVGFLQTLLFVSRHGELSAALEAAITREFPWISLRYVAELRSACGPGEREAQLILVDVRQMADLAIFYDEICRHHPWAHIAIMSDGDGQALGAHWTCVEAGMVHGIVPFNVNLDVLLSILRILLNGGEYFPASACRHRGTVEPKTVPRHVVPPPMDLPDEPGFGDLTGRELEILSAVARGRQNKIIAADLGLSEHTVKLHIHNIITKLGVHNRTEAAILYLERSNSAAASAGLATIEAAGPTGILP